MGKKLHLLKTKEPKKLTVEKVNAVKATAPLNEKTTKIETEKASATDEKLNKFKNQMGRGQPKKEEKEKAKNKTLLYWNEEEIANIEKVAELNGFAKKDKNKYLKSIIKKVVRSEIRQFG